MDCYEEKARQIVGLGGQILLPFDAGDATVKFSSRRTLVQLIAAALREMCGVKPMREGAMAVYTLEPEERLVAMVQFAGRLIVATTHRLFEMEEVPGAGTGTTLEITPILMEAEDADHPETT